MERLLVGDPTKLVTVLPSLEVGHGNRPQSPIVEHEQTKVSAPDSDPGVPSAVRTAENLASGYRRCVCWVYSVRPAGWRANWFDCLVYSGRYRASADRGIGP